MTEIEKATPAMFEDVHRLLVGFENPYMTKDDWRRMLFHYPWSAEEAERGYALFDGKELVGFIGTIFSAREIDGKMERFCNLSSWIVLPKYRARSLELLIATQELTSHTLLAFTPAAVTQKIMARLGYRQLEDRVLLLPPLATLRELVGLGGVSVTANLDEIRAELSGVELRAFDDHQATIGAHILLRRGEETCWAVATPLLKKHIRFAHVHHLSNPRLFWECLPLAKWGFLKAMRAPALAIDARFAEGYDLPPLLSLSMRQPRLYRPSHGDLRPASIDGLYSELMGLRM